MVIQALPLRLVALLGRMGGALAWVLNRRHRKVVLDNLASAFPEKTESEIFQIGRETMLRIGENYAAAVKTASMSVEQIQAICEVRGLENLPAFTVPDAPKNCVTAIGHFGNFELYTILGKLVAGLKPAATYRGLKHPRLNRIMQTLRDRSGCRFFERRTEARALKEELSRGGMFLGLLSDQHTSGGGVWIPFMGRHCATTAAPALFALRYDAVLFTAICYRVSLGRWCVEVGKEIPVRENGSPREVEAITRDINRALEAAVRRDPANWFWVHKRWKPRTSSSTDPRPDAPPADLRVEPASL
jgi:Kdo2-lipid IVA lauroyltransferase/acyltransferase